MLGSLVAVKGLQPVVQCISVERTSETKHPTHDGVGLDLQTGDVYTFKTDDAMVVDTTVVHTVGTQVRLFSEPSMLLTVLRNDADGFNNHVAVSADAIVTFNGGEAIAEGGASEPAEFYDEAVFWSHKYHTLKAEFDAIVSNHAVVVEENVALENELAVKDKECREINAKYEALARRFDVVQTRLHRSRG